MGTSLVILPVLHLMVIAHTLHRLFKYEYEDELEKAYDWLTFITTSGAYIFINYFSNN